MNHTLPATALAANPVAPPVGLDRERTCCAPRGDPSGRRAVRVLVRRLGGQPARGPARRSVPGRRSEHVALARQLLAPGGSRDGTHRAALVDGVVVGALRLLLPLRDNPTVAVVDLAVAPDARRRGHGHRPARRGRPRRPRARPLGAPDGGRRARAGPPGRRFAQRHGWTCDLVETRRDLALPLDEERLRSLEQDARSGQHRLRARDLARPHAGGAARRPRAARAAHDDRRPARRPPGRGGGLGRRPDPRVRADARRARPHRALGRRGARRAPRRLHRPAPAGRRPRSAPTRAAPWCCASTAATGWAAS